MRLHRYEVWSVPAGTAPQTHRPLREARCFTKRSAWRMYVRLTVWVPTLDFYVVKL